MNDATTSLHLKFPISQWPGWNIPELSLTAAAAPLPVAGDNHVIFDVHPNSNGDYSSDSLVVLASIEGTQTSFALKFAMREDLIYALEEESRIYCDALHSLQGTAIPRCFGLYVGVSEEDQHIGCLVLEHFGECIKQPFGYLPLDLKIRILERLVSIHRQGLLHGDFAERNVLLQDGDIRIIDFDQTEGGHRCHFQSVDLRPGDRPPDVTDFGCDHLWAACMQLKIWNTSDT